MQLGKLDTFLSWALHLLAALIAMTLLGLIIDLFQRGFQHSTIIFFTDLLPVMVSTLGIVGICLAVVIPVGLGSALFLSECTDINHPLARALSRILDILAGVPSIVFGLFGSAALCVGLGLGFSLLAGGLTLACMVLPLFTRLAEQSLRSIPLHHRQAAAALGLSKTTVIFKILLPAALPALLSAIVLSIGRSLAETAALLFTSGSVSRMPESIMDPGRSLSVHIYEQAMHVPGGDGQAAASALILVGLITFITVSIRWWTHRWTRKYTL